MNDNPTARYWSLLPSSDSVACELCPQQCHIAPGKTGRCRIRLNRDGKLTAPFYGRFTSLAIDPIEKKPLYHFFPASPILSIGTAGCNLTCRFCQNWSISQSEQTADDLSFVTPEDFATLAEKRGASSVAFTYNEPSIWAEFVIDAAKECHRRGIRTVAVSNGMIRGEARKDFYDVMDAVNIDLKAFTDDFYDGLCGGNLESVKETIRYVARETDVWLEVTNLIIPTHNDSPDEIARMVDWLIETVGDKVPLHFSAFFPTHHLTDVPRTSPETLYVAMKIAQKAGIQFVYVGNIGGDRGHSTLCPHCGEEVIHRNGFRTTSRIIPEFSLSPEAGSTEPANSAYSLPSSPIGPLIGGYRFAPPKWGPPRQEKREIVSDDSQTPHGVCPHCQTVIPGRFF